MRKLVLFHLFPCVSEVMGHHHSQVLEGGQHKEMLYILIPLTAINCVCTGGQAYLSVEKYESKNNRLEDDIQFEFKTSKHIGLIMYAGGNKDSIEVAYKDGNVLMYNINLGRGICNFTTIF